MAATQQTSITQSQNKWHIYVRYLTRSRNPLYLGAVGVLAGIALAGNLAWVLVMLALSIVLCQVWLIAPEERYLSASFGEEYRRYTATVRRWI